MESRSATLEDVPPAPAGFDASLPLTDARGRAYSYLRVSLTDRCNLACVYCMPPNGEDEHALRPELLSFEEIVRAVAVFAAGGVRRVRFTGGEPLVRRDVVRLVEMVRQSTPVDDLVMTTNGVRLAELAQPLKAAGLDGVNVSIDSLDRQRFFEITRGGELLPVLAGIRQALDSGLEVKLNVVALGGVNEDELGDIVDFAWSLGVTPRFIELMPIGEGSSLPNERFIGTARVVELLGDRVEGAYADRDAHRGPARYLRAKDGSGRKVGFITAVTDEFCATCNRVRLTAKGDLRACLAHRRAVSLRDRMRAGASDAELSWAIRWALATKHEGHEFGDAGASEHEHVGMSLIGG
jgi:cyclic pyranopterin phosphate synthase